MALTGFPSDEKIIQLKAKLLEYLNMKSNLSNDFWKIKFPIEGNTFYIQGNIYRVILKLDKIWSTHVEKERCKITGEQPIKFLDDFIKWTYVKDLKDDDEIVERIVKYIVSSTQLIEILEKCPIVVL